MALSLWANLACAALVALSLTAIGILHWIRNYGRKLRVMNALRREELRTMLGRSNERTSIVGFFHPYCNAGGGGERVLWTAIASIQRAHPDVLSVVYSGDIDTTKGQILEKVKSRFNISLDDSRLHFVFLETRHLVEDSSWPRFTLLGQSLGSMWLSWEAMTKLIPDLYIDTMGYAFTFPVVTLLGGIPVGAYVHYPTISTDMLARVKSRIQWHTNANNISSSSILSQGKLLYYRVLMYYYALCLRTASFLMVNSTWTKNHIDSILRHSDLLLDIVHSVPPFLLIKLFSSNNAPKSARCVYPPCDTQEISSFVLTNRERVVLSIAQFRPEKDHAAQLHAFKGLLETNPQYNANGTDPVQLVMVGGSRNAEDAKRVVALRRLAQDLGIEQCVKFIVNASYPVVLDWLSRASVGLSTMQDEHFGINVVEFMAAGVIPVVHASAGPLLDIVVPFDGQLTGYHARTPSEFATELHTALSLPPDKEIAIRQRARTWAVQRFSEQEFEKGWNSSGWSTYLQK
ncbi:mannosyltransferase [Coprinopsis marcescibilis]|uniref:GDP-Man:Man(3)GlcNAc(2)-PP-Dol alpha-1,2-mannosyltransferase n=1 Tax=Coprinopsis marcescibilis TaxID=230819 RepID=A0A5C3L4F6_COPMA|nr:mannosyltransferase [Coprinopsis marcescibilis]